MSDILRGNFKTRNEVKPDGQAGATLEEKFEKEALKKLGGSIAFVSKKKVLWDLKESDNDEPKSKD